MPRRNQATIRLLEPDSVYRSRLVQQLPRVGAWGPLLPAVSALAVTMIGLWLTAEAVSRL